MQKLFILLACFGFLGTACQNQNQESTPTNNTTPEQAEPTEQETSAAPVVPTDKKNGSTTSFSTCCEVTDGVTNCKEVFGVQTSPNCTAYVWDEATKSYVKASPTR